MSFGLEVSGQLAAGASGTQGGTVGIWFHLRRRRFDSMHRTLFLAAAVLLTLAGCRKADVEQHVATAPVAATPEITEKKAEALEQNAAAGNTTVPPAEVIKRPEAQALDPTGKEPLDDALTCLARTVYWEARGDSEISMEAIANVVMNRLGHDGFPDTVCGVVKQGHEQGLCQFSWWCDGRSDSAFEEDPYKVSKEIARRALNLQLTDATGGALYFHHRDVNPNWAPQYLKTVEIGKFAFYKPRDGEAR
jgi:spore germination cell wall hydrolase CwlJ-like protein